MGDYQSRVGNRKWMLSKLFASLRSALSDRGGVHPWSLAFIRMARLKSVVIRRICVIRVPSFILPPRVFCGESMLAPHSYFKKCSSARFDYQVFRLHFPIFFKKKSLNCLARIKIRLTFASAFRKEAVLKKRSLKDLDMNKQVVQD